MDFYYIADKRTPNEIKHGNKRNKFYQKKGSVKSQFTSTQRELKMHLSYGDDKRKQRIQEELDNLTIMVVSGKPREFGNEPDNHELEELKDILKNLDKLSVYLSWCDDVDIDEKTKLDSQRKKLKQVIERMEK